jgi:DHA2 family multidrug resistance protein
MWYSAGLDPLIGFWDLSAARMLLAMWLPFLFIPLNSIALVGVPADRSNEASALINLMRNLGGSVGISYTTTLLAYREQFHHARLAEHITPYNGFGAGMDLGPISRALQTQAVALSYVDIFTALAVIAVGSAILALLLPRMPKGTRSMAH